MRVFLVGFIIALAHVAMAGPLTPKDIALTEIATSPQLSPDGKHIAWTRVVPRNPIDGEDGPAQTELHVVDLAGKDRLFVKDGGPRGARWTADGKALTFLTKRSGDDGTALYRIPVDGGEAERLFGYKRTISAYSMSPDGTRVAFISKEEGDNGAGALRKKGFDQTIYEEDRGLTRAYVATIGKDDVKELPLKGSASAIVWAPKGEHVAVTAAPTALVDDKYMESKVFVFDARANALVGKVENPGKLAGVSFNPKGDMLAIVSGADKNDPRAGRILVAPATGGKGKMLLVDWEGHAFEAGWQDNDTIVFMGDKGENTVVGTVEKDGDDLELGLGPGALACHGLTLGKKGRRWAAGCSTAQHPTEIFSGDVGKDGAKRLTTHNPWLADRELGKQEVIEYKARDGQLLRGVLIHPVGAKAGTRYPLIVHVHGGPEAHVQNGWVTKYSYAGQMGAGRGFYVFYPNYRGSTGRGLKFSKLSQADPAGKEFDDIVDGVDHLVKEGRVDAAKVGVSGGSYGGYAAAWMATYYTKKFAASVMFVGISNKVSKAGTTDIAQEEYHVHTRQRAWDDWDKLFKASPIKYVTQAETPLLIMHGENDTRVHPGQAMEIFRHLKLIGKAAVRLVFFKGEGHGNRRAASRLDYCLRHIRWMEHYLKKGGGEIPTKSVDYKKVWDQ